MSHALLQLVAVVCTFVAGAGSQPEPGWQLTYQGKVAELAEDRSTKEASKTFDLTLLVSAVDEQGGAQLNWLVEERGRGAWNWSERFGLFSIDAQGRLAAHTGPSLLYNYGEGASVIELIAPLFKPEIPLQPDAAWMSEGLDYQVDKAEKVGQRMTWRVHARNGFGPQRTIWVDQDSPWVVALTQRVFMNMGTEHELRLELVRMERLPEETFAATRDAFAALVALRGKMGRSPRTEGLELTADDRTMLKEALPAVEKSITHDGLAKVVRAAASELRLQGGRADALVELTARYMGTKVGKFSAPGLGTNALTADDLLGKVTVLHFWTYRDTPLQEPYGQVGYLEFLHSRRKEEGMQLYGVAVDARLKQPEEQRAVASGVRKLKSFMNLSYPILLDGGDLIKQFGDPRVIGAELPLFVVIGRDGKIVHYHSGFYEVDRQAGLKVLDAAVGAALEAK